MKNFQFPAIALLFLYCFSSCKEDKVFQENSSSLAKITMKGLADIKKGQSGDVVFQHDEYFDQHINNISTTVFASFAREGKKINAGSIKVNDIYTLKKDDNFNYLLDSEIDNSKMSKNLIRVKLTTSDSKLKGFEKTFPQISSLSVKSNIGTDGTFNLNQDLKLKWTIKGGLNLRNADEPKVYIAICAEGVAPITRELKDTGEATITKSELRSIPTGSDVFVHVGRLEQDCTDTETCVSFINLSKSGSLVAR
jgi:hypothetical protein